MKHVMDILRHIYQKDSEYSIVAADSTVADAKAAFDKGVECILNFSPTTLIMPEDVKVKDVDLSRELETLSYFCLMKGKTGK